MLVNMMFLWALLIIPFLVGMYVKQDKTIINYALYQNYIFNRFSWNIMLILRNFKTNPVVIL